MANSTIKAPIRMISGVKWNQPGDSIPLNKNKYYALFAGNSSSYAILFIVHDGTWQLKGTNTSNVSIDNDNLIIPIYQRYILIESN